MGGARNGFYSLVLCLKERCARVVHKRYKAVSGLQPVVKEVS